MTKQLLVHRGRTHRVYNDLHYFWQECPKLSVRRKCMLMAVRTLKKCGVKVLDIYATFDILTKAADDKI